MFRTPAKPPRKDFKCEKVIIHENADNAIKPHLVRFIYYSSFLILYAINFSYQIISYLIKNMSLCFE